MAVKYFGPRSADNLLANLDVKKNVKAMTQIPPTPPLFLRGDVDLYPGVCVWGGMEVQFTLRNLLLWQLRRAIKKGGRYCFAQKVSCVTGGFGVWRRQH